VVGRGLNSLHSLRWGDLDEHADGVAFLRGWRSFYTARQHHPGGWWPHPGHL